MSKERGVPANELLAKLNADPEFQRRQAEKERKRQERQNAFDRLIEPCLNELRSHGFIGESIRDIVKTYSPLPDAAVTILLSSLPALSEPRVAEAVVRALAAAGQPFDGRPLVRCFESTNDEEVKWAIINTVACARPHSIDAWLSEVRKSPYWDNVYRKLNR
jgi:hypothetical protein